MHFNKKSIRHNLCIVGDEIANGTGDTKFLGWSGRVLQLLKLSDEHLHNLNLSVLANNGDTINQIYQRCIDEALPRFSSDQTNKLVLCLTNNDIGKVLESHSRLLLSKTFDLARRNNIHLLVLGPTPRKPEEEEIISLNNHYYSKLCHRYNTQYVDLFMPLVRSEQWLRTSLANNYTKYDQTSYGLIAYVVAHSNFKDFFLKGVN